MPEVTLDEIVALCKRRQLHLPGVRDLRRFRQHLQRALRRPAQEQRQKRVVALDAAGARRHRGAGLGDHPKPQGLGGVRALSPASRTPSSSASGSASSAFVRMTSASSSSAQRTAPRARFAAPSAAADFSEPRQFNLMFQTYRVRRSRSGRVDGPICGPRRRRASSSTSRTSCSSPARSRLSGSPRSASPSATKSPPRRIRLSHPRVRADGNGILLQAGGATWNGTTTGSPSDFNWYTALRHPARQPAPAPARRRRARALQPHVSRRGIQLPDGLGRVRGNRAPEATTT